MRAIRDDWVSKLRALSAHMREASSRCEATVKELVDVANRAGGGETVRALLKAYVERVRRECELEIRTWRAEALVADTRRMPDTSSIDRSLSKLEADNPAIAQAVRGVHSATIKNVEHELCLELQDECQKVWMAGLRI